MLAPASTHKRRFQLVLIKPSHYDADGYVIQWLRSSIPANSLAAVHSLASDAAARHVLGSDGAIDISAMDETNTRVNIKDIIAQFKRHDGFGMVGLVGVQSNQFPLVLRHGRQFRPQQGLRGDLRSYHPAARARRPEHQDDHPGRYLSLIHI